MDDIYHSNTRRTDNGFSTDCLRFYRDETFLESSITSGEQPLDLAQVATWFNTQQRSPNGRYKVIEGEIWLNFEYEKRKYNFQCTGVIDIDGQLEIDRYKNSQPVTYKKYQP